MRQHASGNNHPTVPKFHRTATSAAMVRWSVAVLSLASRLEFHTRSDQQICFATEHLRTTLPCTKRHTPRPRPRGPGRAAQTDDEASRCPPPLGSTLATSSALDQVTNATTNNRAKQTRQRRRANGSVASLPSAAPARPARQKRDILMGKCRVSGEGALRRFRTVLPPKIRCVRLFFFFSSGAYEPGPG